MRLLLIFIIICTSCNKKENFENSQIKVDTLTLKTFDYKYKNEPKYFLKFWKNMTTEDFNQAKKMMKNEGLIDLSYDKYGNFYDPRSRANPFAWVLNKPAHRRLPYEKLYDGMASPNHYVRFPDLAENINFASCHSK